MRTFLPILSAVILAPWLSGCEHEECEACDVDGDGDGYLPEVDCDDDDAAVHPGATEVGNDAVDNDCDTLVDCDDDGVPRTFEGDVGEAEVATVCAAGCTLSIAGSVTLDATALTDLDALSCVTAIDGDLYIRQNEALTSISGLSALTTVGGNVSIGEYWCEWSDSLFTWECTGYGNPALASYDGLQNLESVGGWLWLADSDLVVDPGTDFEKLAVIGGNSGMGLLVDGHAAMTRMPDFPLITALPAFSEVWGNDALVDLSGLSAMEWVESLSVAYNHALQSPLGLDALLEVSGLLVFVDNGNTSMAGLEALTTVGLWLEFWDNPALLSFDGLGALESVGWDLRVVNNDALIDMSGLDSLTSVADHVTIQDNDSLASVDGLESLRTITGYLQIMGYYHDEGNASLVDLDGLWGLEKVGGVIIQDNPALSDAEAQELVDHIEHICEDVTIVNNGG